MKGRKTRITRWLASTTFCVIGAAVAAAQHGVILDQQLNASGRGYTVMRVWGSHYEMGYAQATLLGDAIVQGVSETKTLLNQYNLYNTVRQYMDRALWLPAGIEDEFDGMVDCLALTHPAAGVDKLDLKAASSAGEWLYGCRSHSCWGRYVAPPIKTLSTRRLDFTTLYPTMNHHVLCARVPADGSPRWVNLGWPGIPTAATGVNEFGTIVSLHDYQCDTDFGNGRLPRMVACRYALTYATDPDVSTHLDSMFAEFQNYQLMTGTFLNYYAPEGHGGVIVGHPYHPDMDFYYLRKPQEAWHHGEAIITTNAWTDGTYTPSDENFGADAYYADETPKTQLNHWNLLSGGMHRLSVAYRGRQSMTLWADGRLASGRTPRLEWEWTRLFGMGDCDNDGDVDLSDLATLLGHYGMTAGALDTDGDLNGDGDVDLSDLATLLSNYGAGVIE